MEPAGVTIPVGKNGQMCLILENASTGLSGYNLSLTITDPTVAHITGITYPEWAGMEDTTVLPAASCIAKALDLDDRILSGTDEITLLNVSIGGLSPGNCSLSVMLNQIDDDQGNPINTSSHAGSVTIRPLILPEVNFTAEPRSGIEPLSVNFTDHSTGNITAWEWDFGDGSHSAEQNPSHLFNNPGNYSVILTVTNEDGTSQATYSDYIQVIPSVSGGITFDAEGSLTYTPGDLIHFSGTNTESPETYFMITGPGLIDTGCRLQNFSCSVVTGDPTTLDTAQVQPDLTWHYQWNTSEITGGRVNPGIYTVYALSAPCTTSDLSECMYDALNITIILPVPDGLTADFTSNCTGGYAPLPVSFTDLSTGDPAVWEWDFGDGSPPDSERNPVHNYSMPGLYSVALNVSNTTGYSLLIRDAYIRVNPPPEEPVVAHFTMDVVSGSVPLEIRFIDNSTGNATAWTWDFGDSGSSVDQNPTHLYTEPGIYTVTLTISETGSTDTFSLDEAVKVYAAYYSLKIDAPGIRIEGASHQEMILEKEGYQGSLNIGDGTVSLNNMGGDFSNWLLFVDNLTQNDTVISGQVTSAILTSRPLVSLIEPYGDLSPFISVELDRIPVTRNLTIGFLPGTYLTDRSVYLGAAQGAGKKLNEIYYTMEIDASEIEDDVYQGAVIMPVPLAIADSQGRTNIRIFRNTGTGCSLLDTITDAVGSDLVVFRGISPGGFSIFAIGSVSSPQYSVPSGGGGGGGGGSPVAAPQSQSQPLPEEEPQVPEPSPFQVQDDGVLSDPQSSGVSESGMTTQERLDNHADDQTLSDAAMEGPSQTSDPDYAQSARSELESGHYIQALADSVRAAGGERKPCSPLAASIPPDACPICAVAAGLGVAALGAALSSGGSGSRSQGRTRMTPTDKLPEKDSLNIGHRLERFKQSLQEMSRLKTLSRVAQWEQKRRNKTPVEREAVLFEFSLREILISGISVVLFGIAFLFAGRMQAQLQTFAAFILAGAVAVVAHELVTVHYARKYGFASELRFWGLGSAILLATAGLFGVVFGKPSQTLLEGTKDPDPKKKALVLVSGPMLNIMIAVFSLMLIPVGGFFTVVGITGFSINLLLGVYTLSPIPQMRGRALYDWNKGYWAAIYIPLIALFIGVYLAI